jgi:hypothetical protein
MAACKQLDDLGHYVLVWEPPEWQVGAHRHLVDAQDYGFRAQRDTYPNLNWMNFHP